MLVQQLRCDDNVSKLFQKSFIVPSPNACIQRRLEVVYQSEGGSTHGQRGAYRASSVKLSDHFSVARICQIQRLWKLVPHSRLESRSPPRGKICGGSVSLVLAVCFLHWPTLFILSLP